MAIELICEVSDCPEGLETFLGDVSDACMQLEGVENAGFAIRIVDDEEIHRLNREMRGIDSATDVLSFPTVRYPAGTTAKDNAKRLRREYDPYCGWINLGDCVINLKRAEEQAKAFGHSLKREIGYLTAHSAFHLMGYDHMNPQEKALMRAMEKQAMQRLQLYRTQQEEENHAL